MLEERLELADGQTDNLCRESRPTGLSIHLYGFQLAIAL